ncbi:MAG: hypothetical protein JWP25_6735 [Bradyrhizobium sp.]|nr:hypothetical protein [Bradyrhizobium sp.]
MATALSQKLSCLAYGVQSTPVTTTNSLVQNFSFTNGGVYQAANDFQMYGCDGPLGSVPIRIADQLITAGYAARVIMAPMSVGGVPIAYFGSGAGKSDIVVMAKRLASVGIVPDGILLADGESDAIAGTSSAAWQASFAQVVSTFRGNGINCNIYVAKSTYAGGVVSATI